MVPSRSPGPDIRPVAGLETTREKLLPPPGALTWTAPPRLPAERFRAILSARSRDDGERGITSRPRRPQWYIRACATGGAGDQIAYEVISVSAGHRSLAAERGIAGIAERSVAGRRRLPSDSPNLRWIRRSPPQSSALLRIQSREAESRTFADGRDEQSILRKGEPLARGPTHGHEAHGLSRGETSFARLSSGAFR